MNAFRQYPDYESETHIVSVLAAQDQWKVNCYLVTSKRSGHAFLIDPAVGSSELITFLSTACKKVDFVLLTHGHFDHLASASAVCSEYDIPCVVHSGDYRLVRQAPFYSIRFDGTQVKPPRNLVLLDSADSPLCDEWGVVKTLLTPGHTPGGCSYIVDQFVFTGDTIIREAIGRTDNPGADVEELSNSVERILQDSPEEGIVLPGHGRPWTITEAKKWWEPAKINPPKLDKFINT